MARDIPDDQFERTACARGFLRVVGVDEAGRGPLAGPVVAAAVRLDLTNVHPDLADSKQLSARKRDMLFDWLHQNAEVAIAEATVDEIDAHNILRASHMAMERATLALSADFALIDGNLMPKALSCPGEAIVKGDARSVSIAAASILAKVHRDRIMVDLAQQYPGYGWEKNAGYPTAIHRQALLTLGVSPAHRRSFAPIHKILYQDHSPSV